MDKFMPSELPEYFAKPGIVEGLHKHHPMALVRQMAHEILTLRQGSERAAPKAELAEYAKTVAHMRDGARLQDSATAAVLERAKRAEAELEACREDAERYRYLRTPKVGHHQVMFWMSEPARYVDLDWNELDAAVDRARKEGA